MSTRAQSESIGIILLTAVVVVTVGTAGSIVLADVGGEETTRADLSVEIADEGVSVAHNGGESVAFDDLRVVVRHGNETWRPPMNGSGLLDNDSNARFDAGERWVWSQPLDTSEITVVQVFDRRTGTLLAEERRYPTVESSLTPTATPNETATATVTVTSTGTPTATPAPSETATPTDTVAPTIDTSWKSQVTADRNADEVRISSLTVSDDRSLDRVEITVKQDGSTEGTRTITSGVSGTTWSASSPVVVSLKNVKNKQYTVSVTVYDAAGNSATQTTTVQGTK
ncbi:type IV pilin [Halolamina salina]|uniref:Type IV pilin n=1 Tax=Halolamina salina TaxID=1220023 RepID=A0ABD6B753_9EURY